MMPGIWQSLQEAVDGMGRAGCQEGSWGPLLLKSIYYFMIKNKFTYATNQKK